MNIFEREGNREASLWKEMSFFCQTFATSHNYQLCDTKKIK